MLDHPFGKETMPHVKSCEPIPHMPPLDARVYLSNTFSTSSDQEAADNRRHHSVSSKLGKHSKLSAP